MNKEEHYFFTSSSIYDSELCLIAPKKLRTKYLQLSITKFFGQQKNTTHVSVFCFFRKEMAFFFHKKPTHVFQAAELFSNFFEAGKGWHDGWHGWHGWHGGGSRVKTMEFCQNCK